jgi:hypothetical protein
MWLTCGLSCGHLRCCIVKLVLSLSAFRRTSHPVHPRMHDSTSSLLRQHPALSYVNLFAPHMLRYAVPGPVLLLAAAVPARVYLLGPAAALHSWVGASLIAVKQPARWLLAAAGGAHPRVLHHQHCLVMARLAACCAGWPCSTCPVVCMRVFTYRRRCLHAFLCMEICASSAHQCVRSNSD